MSNNVNTPSTIRWQLLSTVSAFALLTSTYATGAAAADTDRPLIWIELGGQMENVNGQGDVFAPAFLAANPTSPVLRSITPLQAQKPAKFDFGEEGKISFQPENSDWIFSAAIRYGRSSNKRHVDHQTDGIFYVKYHSGVPLGKGQLRTQEDFADTHAGRQEDHLILDFSAGKDVGLGFLGRDSSSTLNLGVRFAQFSSKAAFDIRARPDLQFKYDRFPAVHATLKLAYFHTYLASGEASRNFHGVGPSLAWNGSVPFVGNSQDGELEFDWGANAALLFGRQRARVQHHETGHYVSPQGNFVLNPYNLTYQNPAGGHSIARSITVPNAGGSVGLSWRVQNFKASLGYRADFFFGAMDGGIDARKSETLGFKGPYASISVGMGD